MILTAINPLTTIQALFEGVALIASPCILPVLPLILSSSISGDVSGTGGKSYLRSYGVLAGFVVTFSAFTLLSRQLLQYLGIQPQWLQLFAEAMLILMGLILCSEKLSDAFSRLTQPFAQWGQNLLTENTPKHQNGFGTGFFLGGCIGLIWTPCAGPILASVIVQTALEQSNEQSVLSVLAFALGAGFPMLLIARSSQWVLSWLTWAKENSLMIRKLTGAVILATVFFTLQQGIISLPGNSPSSPSTATVEAATLTGGLSSSYKAPEVDTNGAWINSKPLSTGQLKGKVVLIDFWTYSCINCLRTLPYIKQWYERYHAQGLEIIGVHTPEFLFEQDINNVRNAVTKQGIKYPVTLDNQYRTWRNFNNQYWPAHYLINKEGQVVYTHFGEGAYDVTENNIRALLGLKVANKEASANTHTAFGEAGIGQTPETYLGYEKGSGFSSPESLQRDKTQVFSYPSFLPVHAWALSGKWELQSERSIARQSKASFRLNFYGKSAHMVMGTSTHKPVQVTVKVNGKPSQTLNVQDHKLYTLTTLPKVGNAQVDLETSSPGLAIYALTFGS